jgi:hypothetical protein
MENQKKYEVAVKEFGNGAHITVPKEWIGQIAQVELVGPYCPPLFNQVTEECEIFMDVGINDDEKEMESGFDEDVLSVTGEVIEFEQTVNNDNSGMSAQVLIDAKTQFYRVRIQREAGDDGWDESEYIVEKDISGDEMQETDEIISMVGGSMWKPIGNVNGFGVKQRV